MICKQCGTESRGDLFCPRCGAPMLADTAEPPKPVTEPEAPAIKPEDLATEPEDLAAKPEEPEGSSESEDGSEDVQTPENGPEKGEKSSARAVRRPPLRLSMVIWQVLALLLPLAYLFFDAFVVYSDALFLNAVDGRMHLLTLVERLASTLYAGNTVGELAEATMGEVVTLTQSVSLASVMAGEELAAAFLVPFAVLLLFVAICTVCAVFLLLTGGRILRWRAFCNLTLLGGTGATFAPMIGMLIMAVSHTVRGGIDAADIMMLRILPSFEYLCIMGVLMCALLPAMSSIKGLCAYARRQNGFLTAPFGTLEKRSFRLKKVLAVLSLLVLAAIPTGFFLLPVSKLGSLSVSSLVTDFKACFEAVMAYKDALIGGAGADHMSVVKALLGGAMPLATAVLLLCALLLIYDLLRILGMRSVEATKKKGATRVLKNVERNARGAVLAPYISFVALQVIAVLFWLIATPAISHLNFSNVDQTVSVLYLAIAYVRTVSGTGVLYALMTLCGMLLWYTLGRSADAMHLSERIGKKKKKGKSKKARHGDL